MHAIEIDSKSWMSGKERQRRTPPYEGDGIQERAGNGMQTWARQLLCNAKGGGTLCDAWKSSGKTLFYTCVQVVVG